MYKNSLLRTLVLVFGVVFTAVGLLGFVNNPVLGLFQVDFLHNLVHLAFGIAAFASLGTDAAAATYAKVGGVVYGVLALVGLVTTNGGPLLGIVTANTNDTYLHIFLALALLAIGFGIAPKSETSAKM